MWARGDVDGAATDTVIARSYDPEPIRGTVNLRNAPGADVDAFDGDLDAFFKFVGSETAPDAIIDKVAE